MRRSTFDSCLVAVALMGMVQASGRATEAPAFTEPGRVRLSAGLGSLSGESTYRIGGLVRFDDGSSLRMHFPISELAFPLDVAMPILRGGLRLTPLWSVEAEIGKNLTTDAGSMEDSDWFLPGWLVVYSRSETTLDALLLDARVKRWIYGTDRLQLALAAGLRRERFSFECGNTVQRSVLSGYDATVVGKTVTYDVAHTLVYLGMTGQYDASDRLQFLLSVGFSPLVAVEDEDAHLVRSPPKFSEGSYRGAAMLFSLGARHTLRNGWFLAAKLDTSAIRADGDQEVRSGSSRWTVEAEIESARTLTSIEVGRFW